MPMYEYGCQACDTRFDLLRRMDQEDIGIACPRCKSDNVRRRLSVFASHSRDAVGVSAAATTPVAGTGGCCGGSCGCGSRAA